MLTRNDLIEYGETTGFNLGQIEKDYIQHMFLINLYRRIGNELVFKGGTALQKCYGLNRFSEDLDFALFKIISFDEVINRTIKGMNLFGCEADFKKLKEDEIAISFQIRARGPLYDGREKSLTYIRIEISKREKILLPVLKKDVVPIYRDLPPYLISVMNPSEIMAEKVRAIITRDRARDIYDLYFLLRKKIKTGIGLIEEKLLYYNVEFDIDTFLISVERKEKLWYNELNQLIPNVPDFQVVKKEIESWMRKQKQE
ncbi:MAG TPA: nucleotidyl transferase AbiEii/AbiGii toxin family protein [Thermoplasmatales archaeon]|nr:nucleotidyl transferase AbiEii/AbiGii toxin family protein [Thermoplasmatales archaeon]